MEETLLNGKLGLNDAVLCDEMGLSFGQLLSSFTWDRINFLPIADTELCFEYSMRVV